MSIIIEKRECPRVPTDIFVLQVSDGNCFLHPAINLSEEGISFYMDDSVHIDSIIHLEFSLPNSNKTIRVKGKVAWVEQHSPVVYSVGLRFMDLSAEDQRIIQNYIERYLTASAQQAVTAG
jgi:Tfp pilus assembly protein PilZ